MKQATCFGRGAQSPVHPKMWLCMYVEKSKLRTSDKSKRLKRTIKFPGWINKISVAIFERLWNIYWTATEVTFSSWKGTKLLHETEVKVKFAQLDKCK